MALIKCLECGKEVSDQAKNCPNCGYPLEKMSEMANENKPQNVVIEPTQPVKKKSGCLKGCLIAVVVFIGFIALVGVIGNSQMKKSETKIVKGQNESEGVVANGENQESETTISAKELAGQFDEKVWSRVVEVIKANNNLMATMDGYANLQVSELDFYNTCKEVSKYCSNASVSFPKGESEDEKSYVKSCETLAVYVQMSADSLKKYIDSKATKDLSKAQENIQLTQQALSVVANNRGVYLVKTGFTDEEIKVLTDKMSEEIGE